MAHRISSLKRFSQYLTALLILGFWGFLVFGFVFISRMDGRFFQPSFHGLKGLVLYELGDYRGAASAYKAHFRQHYQNASREEASDDSDEDPGWQAMMRGDFQEARSLSKKALKEDSTGFVPLLVLGQILLEEGMPDQALENFNQVLQREKDQFDALLLSSVAYSRMKNYEKAVQALNLALRHHRVENFISSFFTVMGHLGDLNGLPEAKKPFCLLAHYYRYLRIYDHLQGKRAIEEAGRAIEMGDQADEAYMTMGIVYYKEGNSQKALSTFQKAIVVNPKNAGALNWASVIYSERGDFIHEYEMIKSASESAERDLLYTSYLTRFLSDKLGDYDQAIRMAEKSLASHPGEPQVLHQIGSIYLSKGDFAQSLEYEQEAYSYAPSNTEILEGLGHTLDTLGRKKEAADAFLTALSLDPFLSYSHLSLGGIYRDGLQYRDAIKEYKLAIRFGEDRISTRENLCELYFEISEFKVAAGCFRKILAEDPNNDSARQFLTLSLNNLKTETTKK